MFFEESTISPVLPGSLTDTIAGVRLSFLQEFINNCGGKSVLEVTTINVCERFVKPATAPLGGSYCDLLRLTNSSVVGINCSSLYFSCLGFQISRCL